MRISQEPGDIIVTHALGSCLGISVHDAEAKVGGIFHVLLPQSSVNPDKAEINPYMFVDSGTPQFFKEIYKRGGKKGRLEVKVAGGASMKNQEDDFFNIGKRNFVMLRKLFWKNGIMISGKDVGGQIARTLYLEIGTGRTWLQSNGRSWDL
ncbi:MAG: chemotaxis protein CheD [Planctomycetes bacterium]|nr:chemotaxis protein CheD [Planctomycetota bacterium]